MIYILFIVGIYLLVKGAQWLVSGASAIAKIMGISEMVIGLTIVSIGTSLPELLVNVMASISGNVGIATGNILGSNIINILLTLGVVAMIKTLPVQRNTAFSEIPFSIAAAMLLGFLANSNLWYEQADDLHVSRGDGIIMMFFFALFLAYTFTLSKETITSKTAVVDNSSNNRKTINLLKCGIGIIALTIGGHWVVQGAVQGAKVIGISDTVIGLTVVAFGTSLPEFVTSIKAALNNNTNIAIGNAIGSNIFNLLWILGLSAVIKPLPFNTASNIDILMVIGASCLLLLAMIVGRKMSIGKIEGFLFLLIYIAYMVFIIKRG